MSQLIAYRVPPQQEFKAARELREHGHKAYVPRDLADKRKPPVARGYVFSGGKHAFARHVRSPVGPVNPLELRRLYVRRPAPPQPERPFSIGERVEIKDGPFAKLRGTIAVRRGRRQWLIDTASGKLAVQSQSLVRIDPG